MKRLSVLCVAAIVSGAFLMAQGCSSGERTTTTTRVTRPDGGAAVEDGSGSDMGQTTTTITTTKSDEPDSVLGATAHAVATIILFPFRLIGDALGLLV